MLTKNYIHYIQKTRTPTVVRVRVLQWGPIRHWVWVSATRSSYSMDLISIANLIHRIPYVYDIVGVCVCVYDIVGVCVCVCMKYVCMYVIVDLLWLLPSVTLFLTSLSLSLSLSLSESLSLSVSLFLSLSLLCVSVCHSLYRFCHTLSLPVSASVCVCVCVSPTYIRMSYTHTDKKTNFLRGEKQKGKKEKNKKRGPCKTLYKSCGTSRSCCMGFPSLWRWCQSMTPCNHSLPGFSAPLPGICLMILCHDPISSRCLVRHGVQEDANRAEISSVVWWRLWPVVTSLTGSVPRNLLCVIHSIRLA